MSTVQPPPPSPPPSIPSSVPASSSLSIHNPPALLSQLGAGTQIEARVSSNADGRIEIITPLGKLNAETKLPLKVDQSITLQVPNRGSNGPFILQVLEIGGKSVQNLSQNISAPINAGAPLSTQQASGLTATTTLNLTTGSSLTATILGTTPTGFIQQSSQNSPGANLSQTTGQTSNVSSQNLFNQGTVSGVISGVSPGLTSNTTNPSGNFTQQPAHNASTSLLGGSQNLSQGGIEGLRAPSSSNTPQTTTAGSHGSGNLPAGTHFSITIQNLSPPKTDTLTLNLSSSGVSSSIFSTGKSITGTVISSNIHGQSIVHTPSASISITTTQSLPPGTEVTFKVSSNPIIPEPSQPLPASLHREGMIMSQSWPSLEESLSALQAISPQTAQNINAIIMPKLDVQFTATALFFLTALKGGSIKNWLGDNATRLLEKLKPNTMRRLSEDFRLLNRTDEESSAPSRPGDWRGTLIPLHSGEGLQQIRFFTRQLSDDDEDENNPGFKGTRFLIDINLSKIGRLQLDGIVEKSNKRLDMIIRTSARLPDGIRQDITNIFIHANDVVGMHGAMSFQAAPDTFVEPTEEIIQDISGVGIIV